jgi:hypothetical protein
VAEAVEAGMTNFCRGRRESRLRACRMFVRHMSYDESPPVAVRRDRQLKLSFNAICRQKKPFFDGPTIQEGQQG